MDAEQRRKQILNLLSAETPVTGSQLGEKFDVSRQVIVQDIALLRAQGYQIMATPQGYINQSEKDSQNSHIITIASKHEREDIKEELETIVDLGGTILDVMVEHPIYGELKGQLMVKSRRDVQMFLDKLENTQANPLATLTQGVHLHTIEVPSQEAAQEIKTVLKERNFLVKEDG
ncbi:transcription repressor NadR [Natranaerobius thermophilus]|uniref:3H domain protein n=1 Tax=Natranaerobius thermophilus (strain ATCC BAA-1301 / DSM 18059 / JW/NM-WN-LF) TaxID=457570 RepID=B2A0U7_NATTJ|nr:transcription repressor NadR [Natranaerobius thermophilus]ACB85977.1 3H domain protein [Natranaerobius thermophilus JW/NM-WN-LF]